MLKEIEDAVLLHQARDKIESGLAILDNIFALGVAALGEVLKILEAVILKHFLDDLGDGFLLENLAIGGAGEEPEPRNDFGTVIAEAIVAAHASETADEAIPMALVIPGVMDLESDLLSDDVFEGDRVIFREQIGGEMKELRYAFVTAEAKQQKSVLAQRGLDGDETLLLGVGHIQKAPFLLEQGNQKILLR